MSTIVLRTTKGSALTNTEVDNNFSNLNTDKLQLGGTYSSGTANGVTYLNGSKVLTTGSALTFDGTTLGVVGRLYNGSASTFGASTWGMSLGNGGASANYFKAGTTYWQDGAGTQIMQLGLGSLALTGTGNASLVTSTSSTTNGAYAGFKGSGDATIQIGQFSASNAGATFGLSNANLSFIYTTSYASTHASALLIGSASTTPLVFATSSTERMRIDASGNVGIGATSLAGMKLVALGANGYPATSGATQTGVFRISGGTGVYNVLDMGVNESTDTAWMQATRANSLATYDKLVINPYGGNVGIGTTNIGSRLHVVTTAPSITTMESTAANGGYLTFSNGSTVPLYIGFGSTLTAGLSTSDAALRYSNNLVFSSGSAEKMRIDSAGRLLIGGTSTYDFNGQANLVVNGTAGLSTITVASTTSGHLVFADGTSGTALYAGNIAYSHASNAMSFGTNGIFGRVTIDSSGNLLVGSTASAPGAGNTTVGVSLNSGRVFASAASDYSLSLSRSTSDGDIVQFRKDGTTVGNIGTVSGDIFIGNGNTCLLFDDSTDLIRASNASGGGRDATTNLGNASNRFKDLYLSGGVYFGTSGSTSGSGTETSNHLDDYEEGTWTPTITFNFASTGITYTTQLGRYVKIGRQVTIWVYFLLTSKGSDTGPARVMGLPFANSVGGDAEGASFNPNYWAMASSVTPGGYVQSGQSYFILINTAPATSVSTITDSHFTNTTYLYGCATYTV